MRFAGFIILLVLLAGCGGGHRAPSGSSQTPAPGGSGNSPTPNADAGSVRLVLDAKPDGGEWRVNLRAPGASDLYQVGGTLAFDTTKYQVVAVEAGGGLGQPDTSYFVGQETEPGRVAFAYTKRYWG